MKIATPESSSRNIYDLEESRVVEEIKNRKARMVLLQLPEGLKQYGNDLATFIENQTSTVVLLVGDPSWGGCDVAVDEARRLKADLIVHYGHTEFVPTDEIPILFIPARFLADVKGLVREACRKIPHGSRVAVSTTIQHIHVLKDVLVLLEESGLKALTPGKGRHVAHTGQVVGCEFNQTAHLDHEVDYHLFIGSMFHALGTALSVSKPVILVDPYSQQISDLDELKRKILRQRYAAILKAKDAKRFGVVVSSKIGQLNISSAKQAHTLLRKKGRQSNIIALREMTPEALTNFPKVEVFVNTACPRLSTDDPERFGRPVLSIRELLVALEEMTWERFLEGGVITPPI